MHSVGVGARVYHLDGLFVEKASDPALLEKCDSKECNEVSVGSRAL